MMKSKLIVAGLLASIALTDMQAQVRDVSVTVSPLIEFNQWNKNIALKNSPFYGARIGFGFGTFVELRGTFEKSFNVKNELEGKSWNILNQETLDKLNGMDIDITRVGGEAKINILGNTPVSPYITAGTGVQIFDYTPFDKDDANKVVIRDLNNKEKQLYLALGAGLKVNFTDRIALALEARNIRFQMDADNSYIDPSVAKDDKKWGNWAYMASLDFYLGGNPGWANDKFGRAYRNLFSDGFKGIKFSVEPGMAYVDFNDKAPWANQYFWGGSAGIDFSSLLGLRAFYYQATETPGKLNFNFNDNLKMYGANFIGRLNYARGIVPYLVLGAGYLHDNGTAPFKEEKINKKNLFALAGAGLEVPISRWFALYGTVNSMLMSNRTVTLDKVQKPSQLINNMMYTAGLRINLGVPQGVPEYDKAQFDNERINEMREDEQVREARDNDRTREYINKRAEKDACKHMTKKEFEQMVDRIMKKVRSEEELRSAEFSDDEMSVILNALDKERGKRSAANDEELVKEMRNLVDRLDRNYAAMDNKADNTGGSNTTVVMPGAAQAPATTVINPNQAVDNGAAVNANGASENAKTPFMKMNRLGLMTGVNFGDATMWNLGIRGYMQVSNTPLDFVPEVYFGVGNKTGYGLSANLVYNINLSNSPVSPYVGLGLGVFNHTKTRAGTNIILGVNFNNIANGQLFVDYSIRTLFKNNQIAAGYRFVF